MADLYEWIGLGMSWELIKNESLGVFVWCFFRDLAWLGMIRDGGYFRMNRTGRENMYFMFVVSPNGRVIRGRRCAFILIMPGSRHTQSTRVQICHYRVALIVS